LKGKRRGLTDDDADRVEVVKEVVWHAIRAHARCECIRRGTKPAVEDGEDGLEEEDGAGLECPTHIIHKLVVILINLATTSRRAHAGLALLPEPLAANTLYAAVPKAVPQHLEYVPQIGTSGLLFDEPRVKVPQQRG
jgi:hypothetical protein